MTGELALALILYSILAMGLVVALDGLWKMWRLRRRKVQSKIIVYVNLVHRHGLGSEQALVYREENKDDKIFIQRADVFDELKAMAKGIPGRRTGEI